MGNNTTQETLDLVKGVLSSDPSDTIAKSITQATGLTAYDLQGPAKNLYPVLTPIRNSIPRIGGGTGTATNWKQVSAITGSGYDQMPWVPEGQRSGRMAYTTAPKAASFVTIGEEDQVTFEAVNAGKKFEDVRSTMTMRLLQKTMLKEETALLGGNGTLALGTPGTPTLSASGSGATLPGSPTTYSVIVVALTLEGYLQSSVVSGVATSQTVTGADGSTYVINGGSSQKSSAATQAVTLGEKLFMSVVAVNGAVGYAWYVGLAGSEKLQAITTINSHVISAALSTTYQAATQITADCSRNVGLAFDGLMTAAFTPANSAYINYLATGTSGTGTPLTASGRGTVVEIDDMLKAMWDNYQLSATVIYVNSQELKNITNKCLTTSGGASILQVNNPANDGKPYKIAAGGTVEYYFNPFTAEGGRMIPIRLHPKCAPGTILAYCEQLPIHYQNNNVSNVAEVLTRQDYYQIDWPLKTRSYETGVYAEEVLAIYAPFAMGMILNIANA